MGNQRPRSRLQLVAARAILQNAYDSDHQLLQVAIDSWRTDIGLRSTTPWPILEGGDECIGTVNPMTGALTIQGCNPYIDVAAIATQGYVRDSGTLKSADKSSNTTATNAKSGHYAWYIDASSLARSVPTFLANTYP